MRKNMRFSDTYFNLFSLCLHLCCNLAHDDLAWTASGDIQGAVPVSDSVSQSCAVAETPRTSPADVAVDTTTMGMTGTWSPITQSQRPLRGAKARVAARAARRQAELTRTMSYAPHQPRMCSGSRSSITTAKLVTSSIFKFVKNCASPKP